jgi:hypothetical protein
MGFELLGMGFRPLGMGIEMKSSKMGMGLR